MTTDYSEQISFAVNHARHYYPWVFRVWPEDARQTAILGAISASVSTVSCVRRETNRAMYALIRELGRPNVYDRVIERRSRKSAKQAKAKHLRACGKTPSEIAPLVGWTVGTAARYTRLNDPELARQRRAAGGRKGGPIGAERRWGAYQDRRQKARTMRAGGATLKQIQDACGYRSLSAAHYAAKRIQ